MVKVVTIDEMIEEHEKDLEALHRGIVQKSSEDIIDNAPADTGRLKGSVKVSINKEEVVQNNEDPSGQSTKSENKSTIDRIELDDDIFVVIGEDYAKSVNDGTQKVPPTGFYSRVLDNMDPVVSNVIKNLKKYRK